jgi:hypothetical protein
MTDAAKAGHHTRSPNVREQVEVGDVDLPIDRRASPPFTRCVGTKLGDDNAGAQSDGGSRIAPRAAIGATVLAAIEPPG